MSDLLRVVVLDDEWVARDFAAELIEATGLAKVVGSFSDPDSLVELFSSPEGRSAIDAAFVDISIAGSGERAGLEFARALLTRPNAPALVFATAFSQHAVEAFELGAHDYVVKPLSLARVSQALARVAQRRVRPRDTPLRLVARRRSGLVFLQPEDALAFESKDRATVVHSDLGTFDIDLSLARVEAILGDAVLRTHRCWVVNRERVLAMDREDDECVLTVGKGALGSLTGSLRVPVSRERVAQIRNLLLQGTAGIRNR